jgi:hypothetical protein
MSTLLSNTLEQQEQTTSQQTLSLSLFSTKLFLSKLAKRIRKVNQRAELTTFFSKPQLPHPSQKQLGLT